MQEYIAATEIIDWQHHAVFALAQQLSSSADDDESVAKRTFEWVRDNIEHSVDFNRCEVTCKASDVLTKKTGFCYAKSHLLAALMRASRIPTGFCYQRLSVNGDGPPYCVHGLNAVYLQSHGWYRIDARGNSESVCTGFSPPVERLAFSATAVGEADFPQICPAPLPVVVSALQHETSVAELLKKLPDVPVVERTG